MEGTEVGHYRIDAKLGEGGMGTVFKAFDTRLARYVALKTVSAHRAVTAEQRHRLAREARAASSLNHPNIVTVYDILNVHSELFIAMELVEGVTLSEMINKEGVTVGAAVRYGIQIASALAAVHAAGMVHRDLKPSNIMITPQGLVKLLDFGLAKLKEPDFPVGEETATIGLTRDGMVVGSAAYMSPEQAEGQALDDRSDMFSFGLLMFETLTGQRAFQKATALSTLASILHEEPKHLRDLVMDCPAELEAVIERCLRKKPADRFHDMQEVADALEAIAAGRVTAQIAALPRRDRGSAIAVLPFSNLSPDPDNEYFSDGLAEEIITALSKIRSLRVTARTSAFRFRGKELHLREIGEKLRVNYILLGSVRRAGSRVRITVELINPVDECQLWAERYDRTMDDVFSIQDEISGAVVDALRTRIAGISDSFHATERIDELPPRDPEAHDDYLRGRYCLARRSWDSLRRGIEFFNDALRKDPTHALSKVGLADCYNLLGYYNERAPAGAFPLSKRAARDAIELNPALGQAHASLGYSLTFYDWDWTGAEKAFDQSVLLAPGYASARHWKTWMHFARGEFDAALTCMREAQRVDPLAPIVNSHLGIAMAYVGRSGQAIEQLNKTIELDPNFFLAHYHLGTVYCLDGLWHLAVSALETADRTSGSTLGPGLLGFAYGMAGRVEDARRLLERMQEAPGYVSPLELAQVHAGLGDTSAVFRLLGQAVEHRSSDLVRLRINPWPAAVRQDSRFDGIAQRIGLPPS